MPKKKDNPRYVLQRQCDESMSPIRLALFGSDMRGGIVKDIGDIKNKLDALLSREAETKTKGRDWRLLGFAVLGSILAGLVMAGVNYILTHLPH